MSGEPTTPPATAIRRSRRRNLQNKSSNIDETSSSVVSEEIETPTPSGANLSSTNTANMASTNELTPDLADMMRQMLARQNQMEQDMRDREARMELKLASIIQSNTPQASLPSNTTQDTTPMDIQPPLRDASDTNISNAIALVQADVDTLLPDRCRVILTLDNYDAWSSAIQKEAGILNAITTLHQDSPPAGSSPLDAAVWHRKAIVMRARMLNAMTTPASDKLGTVYDLSAHGLWDRAATLFGKSTGEERMALTMELKELYIKDNDYLTYQSSFNRIFDRLHAIGEESLETLITGASRPEQIYENVKAVAVVPKLTPEILERIEQATQNAPATLPLRF